MRFLRMIALMNNPLSLKASVALHTAQFSQMVGNARHQNGVWCGLVPGAGSGRRPPAPQQAAAAARMLYWVTLGKTSKDIGDILGCSPSTVIKHLEHVFEKLGVETRTAAANLAMNKMCGA